MIDAQPPLTLETWKKEIDKMRTAYGCPLRADQTAGIAKFVSHAANAPADGHHYTLPLSRQIISILACVKQCYGWSRLRRWPSSLTIVALNI